MSVHPLRFWCLLETRRGCLIPWIWNSRWLWAIRWVLGPGLWSSENRPDALNYKASFLTLASGNVITPCRSPQQSLQYCPSRLEEIHLSKQGQALHGSHLILAVHVKSLRRSCSLWVIKIWFRKVSITPPCPEGRKCYSSEAPSK